ncbi:uncharacterized protein LOC108216435 [Daucus carota subsp. sativus]|uniref:uncharacterized protein LOC108216435 n=1 Tax=Daucus carota subsp. sativus TaxID=79200 RepID=UPI0007EF14A1|nr:PREDICTED: uncharacterized protein LOC108216435 isoform X1 [Daucus carota subsp. sativus]XP_017244686.1 PREDICTED: uncharacterized protein LOC108216435 isoform X1 [Daucus carota subsp. sativus]XP_017244687.1 PREDICTED: uncharacterized protein LOC108216435 isoform X2 [Daucus carota subsp. sativus]
MQALKRVKEISNLARGSKHCCRAKSSFSAASAPCDAPVVKKTGKRLPIGERRAMVKSFVDRYQGENSGKFPTVSHAKKEVGGSYYVVKKIMQELEYNSKVSSSNDGKEFSSKTEVRSSYLSCGSNSDADEYKPSPETSMLMTTEDVKEMTTEDVKEEEQHKLQLDIESIPDEKPNQYFQQPLPEVSSAKKSENAKEETTCESVLDANNLESKNEEYQPHHEYSVPKVPENSKEVKPNQVVVDMDGSESIAKEHRKSTGESSEKQTLEKVQTNLSIWGTLKSVAGDLFSIWRKG